MDAVRKKEMARERKAWIEYGKRMPIVTLAKNKRTDYYKMNKRHTIKQYLHINNKLRSVILPPPHSLLLFLSLSLYSKTFSSWLVCVFIWNIFRNWWPEREKELYKKYTLLLFGCLYFHLTVFSILLLYSKHY